jgi:hypothetical protein
VAFTSIATAGGWSTDTVTAAYDLLFRWQLKSMPLCRQFVDVRPEQVTHRGSSVKIQLNRYFANADVVAALTPLGEESDVTPTKLPQTDAVTLTPTEHGFANLRTLKLKNRGMVDIDPVIAKAVATHCGDTIDLKTQTAMRAGTQVRLANSAASQAAITKADVAKGKDIRFIVTKLRGQSVATRDGQFYEGLFHPDVVHDLRSESGSGAWRTPKEYVDPGQIYRGEFGEFEGVRFIQSPTLLWGDEADRDGADKDGAGAGTVLYNVYRSYILGAEALGEAVIVEPHIVLGPVVDRLGRFRPVGWYGDFDFSIFRDKALVRTETGTAAK